MRVSDQETLARQRRQKEQAAEDRWGEKRRAWKEMAAKQKPKSLYVPITCKVIPGTGGICEHNFSLRERLRVKKDPNESEVSPLPRQSVNEDDAKTFELTALGGGEVVREGSPGTSALNIKTASARSRPVTAPGSIEPAKTVTSPFDR